MPSIAPPKPDKPPARRTSKAVNGKGVSDRKKRLLPPTAGRALVTYEALIRCAGELLGEAGFEKLTSNEICARAHVTPPTFYHYFDDKYDILAELARRLLKKQSDAFAIWLFRYGGQSTRSAQIDAIEGWLRAGADIVAQEPGGIWTMRALRALPNLAHVRLESQRLAADQMIEFAKRFLPHLVSETLWSQLRIAAEFGYVVDELAIEEDRIPHDRLFKETARLLSAVVAEIAGELST